DGIAAMNAPAFADADLVSRRDDANIPPYAAETAERGDVVVQFGAGMQGGVGDLLGIQARHAVLVIDHPEEQARIDFKDRGPAVGGFDAGATELGSQGFFRGGPGASGTFVERGGRI